MVLTLTVLRCPDGVPPETRLVSGGEFSIGRDLRNDWVLPDPDRFLSKRHCVVSLGATSWQIVDTSTNGCYLNHEIEPIRGKPRGLRDGDRILLGSYEIEVSIQDGDIAHAPIALSQSRPADALSFADDRLTGAPFTPVLADPLSLTVGTSPSLAAHYDPLAIAEAEFGSEPVMQDHGFLDAAYRAPARSVDLLPGDWDEEGAPLPAVPPVPVELPPPVAPEVEAIAEPPPPQAPAPAPAPEIGSDADIAMAAFLRGAGITLPPGTILTNGAIDTLQELGAAFRALVHGLRRIMIARASIKGEFRIEQTMIRPSGNNPLKFSADDEDALAALLNIGRRSDLTPEAAVADALLDTRLHEVAMMTAMRDAVRDLLAQYDPDSLMEAANGKRAAALPAMRKARAWTRFQTHHQDILTALTDDFDSIFGKAFARSYERSLAEAQARQDSEPGDKADRFG
ncbi:type VI secretion system-associated FHA domain protein TagH [Acidisoma cellulosilytica]|uniref:Type VI secretion system-associated FHA domain protein TagH n=1 Tax=Acidisoma cellulosilyticum TaxID=2802395 RepID=A0A963Z1J7_9PROT|nr:type VI secretion system-associated FHA domain protein TagH [Acidisoma cellulosilyticum]MCB8881035.1 type VI secretion system-associated FHA domain protein TagH [Acidisoma cellulosilyticum]